MPAIKYRPGATAVFSFLFLPFLHGCQTLDKINTDLAALNSVLSTSASVLDGGLAPSSPQVSAPVLMLPQNPAAASAVTSAMPSIEKLLDIHRCVVQPKGLLVLNQHAPHGVNVAEQFASVPSYPNHGSLMRYSDKKRCVTAKQVSGVEMLARNTIAFKAMFMAEDSGEMASFRYTIRNDGRGNWQLLEKPSLAN